MQQLESVSSLQANSTEMYRSLLTTRLPSVDRNVASTRPQQGKRDISWQEVKISILSFLTQIILAHNKYVLQSVHVNFDLFIFYVEAIKVIYKVKANVNRHYYS